jgi:hypothetical protein
MKVSGLALSHTIMLWSSNMEQPLDKKKNVSLARYFKKAYGWPR